MMDETRFLAQAIGIFPQSLGNIPLGLARENRTVKMGDRKITAAYRSVAIFLSPIFLFCSWDRKGVACLTQLSLGP